MRSFKGRGTETVMSSLVPRRHSAAVCASAGNLGQALAHSGARHQIPVTVFAATTANSLKIERMRELGATVHLVGDDIELPRVLAGAHAEDTGGYLVEDSLDVDTCEGAATIGLELLGAPIKFDVVVVALGGGALASGLGHVFHELSPRTEVIAVQPTGAPAMALSWRNRSVVTTDTIDTIADGVAGRFPIPEVLDDLLEVVDDVGPRRRRQHQTRDAAALRPRRTRRGAIRRARRGRGTRESGPIPGRSVATIICGSNITSDDFRRWALDARKRSTNDDPQPAIAREAAASSAVD